jgi:hypothetical protein
MSQPNMEGWKSIEEALGITRNINYRRRHEYAYEVLGMA